MDIPKNRKILILVILYAPVILTFAAVIKIWLKMLFYDNSFDMVNAINVISDLCLLGMIYIVGKELHFCWRHASLCRIALWNYIYYIFLAAFNAPDDLVLLLTVLNLIFTIIILIIYEIIDKIDRNNISMSRTNRNNV